MRCCGPNNPTPPSKPCLDSIRVNYHRCDSYTLVDTITSMSFGVCQLSEDLSILVLLQNVNKTPRFQTYFIHLQAP